MSRTRRRPVRVRPMLREPCEHRRRPFACWRGNGDLASIWTDIEMGHHVNKILNVRQSITKTNKNCRPNMYWYVVSLNQVRGCCTAEFTNYLAKVSRWKENEQVWIRTHRCTRLHYSSGGTTGLPRQRPQRMIAPSSGLPIQ